VEDFFHAGPPFAFVTAFDRDLNRHHDFPPFLRFGIGGHFFHVGVVVGAVVFEIGEEKIVLQEDRVVFDVAGPDCRQDFGPNLGVVLLVHRDRVFFDFDQHAVAFHAFLSWKDALTHSV
jgi:hypothetical protein